MSHVLFIHSAVDGHLDHHYFLAFLNNVVMNIHIQVFIIIYILISLEYT